MRFSGIHLKAIGSNYIATQKAKFTGPTRGPSGSCRTMLSGKFPSYYSVCRVWKLYFWNYCHRCQWVESAISMNHTDLRTQIITRKIRPAYCVAYKWVLLCTMSVLCIREAKHICKDVYKVLLANVSTAYDECIEMFCFKYYITTSIIKSSFANVRQHYWHPYKYKTILPGHFLCNPLIHIVWVIWKGIPLCACMGCKWLLDCLRGIYCIQCTDDSF